MFYEASYLPAFLILTILKMIFQNRFPILSSLEPLYTNQLFTCRFIDRKIYILKQKKTDKIIPYPHFCVAILLFSICQT